MPDLLFFSLIILVFILVLDVFSFIVLKIRNNRYYAWFHFISGFFVFLLFFAVFSYFQISNFVKSIASLVSVLSLGVLWEVGEYLFWKVKKKYKPEFRDTINDLMLDFLGGILALIFWNF